MTPASLIAGLLLAPALSYADGLTDLKAALQRLSGSQVIKGQLGVKIQRHQGEGKGATTEQGGATLLVEDGAQGLHTQFAPDLLTKLRSEDAASDQDANAPTPVLLALKALGPRDVRSMTAGAETLGRLLATATLKLKFPVLGSEFPF